jgi:hypothetical protein
LTRSRRLVVAAVAAAGVAVLGVVFAVVSASNGGSGNARGSKPRAVPTARAATLAVEACAKLAQVQRLVDVNGSADTVRALLREAAGEATIAAFSDPRWVQLDSFTQLLRDSFETDDAPGAAEAIAGVRRACAPINPLPVPTG